MAHKTLLSRKFLHAMWIGSSMAAVAILALLHGDAGTANAAVMACGTLALAYQGAQGLVDHRAASPQNPSAPRIDPLPDRGPA